MVKKLLGTGLIVFVVLMSVVLYQIQTTTHLTSIVKPDNGSMQATPDVTPTTVYYEADDSLNPYGMMIVNVNSTNYATIFSYKLWWNTTKVLRNTDFCVTHNGQTLSVAPLGDHSDEIWVERSVNSSHVMLYANGKLQIEGGYELFYKGTDNVKVLAYDL